MTNEEKDLLIAYLVDAGELDQDGNLEKQFQDWYQARGGQVSGEVHYKAIFDAARVRVRSFEEGLRAGFAEEAAEVGWDEWTKDWQDQTKYWTLFANPVVAFMDCIWVQSAIIRLLILHEKREHIQEFVEENRKRGGRLPDWYLSALHKRLRTTDMRPCVKQFREAFGDYLSDRTLRDLGNIARTRNAISHSYIAAGQHIERGTQSAAFLRYAPRNIDEYFNEDTDLTLRELAIEADQRWMSIHGAMVGRVFQVCESIAESLGVPGGMIY